ARSLGIEPDDRRRLQAGLRFVLEEAEDDGNTFLRQEELWQQARALLGAGDPELLEAALHARVREGELVVERDRVYRTDLWETEQRLGAALAARVHGPVRSPLFAPQDRPPGDLSDEQWSVVELVRT